MSSRWWMMCKFHSRVRCRGRDLARISTLMYESWTSIPGFWISLFQGLAKLKDWTSLLASFKSAASRVKPTPAFPGASDTHLKLFKWLSYLRGSNQSIKVKCNLVAAAIHLAFLRNHRFGPEEIPDLTKDIGVLIAAQFSQVLVILYKKWP
jgi:hypothetical protein